MFETARLYSIDKDDSIGATNVVGKQVMVYTCTLYMYIHAQYI